MDCANIALDLLTDEFEDLKRERDAYISFDSVATQLREEFEGKMDEEETTKLIEQVCSNFISSV